MRPVFSHPLLAKPSILALLVVLVSLAVMLPTVENGWVNWDDESFVLNNPLVTELSLKNVKEVFSRIDDNGGYTPLVLLSWSANYTIGGFDASGFHVTNLLLHLINIWLVFSLIFLLTGRTDISVITAILFGIHPTQLEPVAWITSRKDLLYAMFYLAGLLAYLKYLGAKSNGAKRWLLLCLVLFVCSLLSKGMAVTFPIVLLLIDYFKTCTNYLKAAVEKVPFILLSVLFGIIASVGQKEVGAIDGMQNISFIKSFFVASYGLMIYVFKAIAPFHLSAYHPYPFIPDQPIPWFVYASVVPSIGIALVALLSIKRNKKITFGILFFLCCIALVLQLFPVGIAIVAERFTYVANIGLFYLVGLGISSIVARYPNEKKYVFAAFSVYIIILAAITFNRTDVWQDSETLWTDVIEKYPNDFLAYNNRALYYASVGNNDLAILDYSSAIDHHGAFLQSFYDRGILYLKQGDLLNALSDFDNVLNLQKNNSNGYLNRGLINMNLDRPENALNDFNRCIELDPANPLAYFNRSIHFSKAGQNANAIKDLSKALEYDPNNFQFTLARAQALMNSGKSQFGISEYEKCISIEPTNAQPHFEVGTFFLNTRQLEMAAKAFTHCMQLDGNLTAAHTNLGLIYLNQDNFILAEEAFNRAIFLDPKNHITLFNRGLVFSRTNRHEKALTDFSASLLLVPDYAEAYYWRSVSHKALSNKEMALKDAQKAKDLNLRP
jgi:tetratricopeptide (TPR) repeat protein